MWSCTHFSLVYHGSMEQAPPDLDDTKPQGLCNPCCLPNAKSTQTYTPLRINKISDQPSAKALQRNSCQSGSVVHRLVASDSAAVLPAAYAGAGSASRKPQVGSKLFVCLLHIPCPRRPRKAVNAAKGMGRQIHYIGVAHPVCVPWWQSMWRPTQNETTFAHVANSFGVVSGLPKLAVQRLHDGCMSIS